jgi:hypothetical protein
LAIRADTKDVDQINGAKFDVSVDLSSTNSFKVVELEDDKTVTDITPSSVSFKTVEGTAASLSISNISL